MRFFCNKHAILLFAVWLSVGLVSVGLVSVGYAHDRKGHAKDIGVVFGWFSPENDPQTPHGKELRNDIGEIIANLIDVGAWEFHRAVNMKLGDICCDSKYTSLYIKGYNQQVSDLRERIKEIPARLDLLEESNRRKEVIQDLRSISEEMQNDFFFDQDCSAKAFNVELTLNEFEKHLDYNHDVSSDKVRSAFQDLKEALDRVPEMPQRSQNEVQRKIRDLASKDRLFNWGDEYGHRLYFHWGMDVNIRNFKQLNDCVDRSCKDLEKTFFPRSGVRRREDAPPRTAEDDAKIQELQGKLREKIYSLIEEEWEKRKQDALKEFQRCLRKYNNDKLNSNPDPYKMLLKLAYYVHILGDYSTRNTSALIEEKDINEALKKILEDKSWGSEEDNRDSTKLTNVLQSKNTAEDMLGFLKANIPDLIERSPNISNALW